MFKRIKETWNAFIDITVPIQPERRKNMNVLDKVNERLHLQLDKKHQQCEKLIVENVRLKAHVVDLCERIDRLGFNIEEFSKRIERQRLTIRGLMAENKELVAKSKKPKKLRKSRGGKK